MIRQRPVFDALKINKYVRNTVQLILNNNGRLHKFLRSSLLFWPRSLQHESATVLRVWTHQCECVVAQKLRRGHQMFTLYSKLWEERALREFLKTFRQQLTRKSKALMFGAIGIVSSTSYDWDANRIPEQEIRTHLDELAYVGRLKERTRCDACMRKGDTKNSCSHCRGYNKKRVHEDRGFDEWVLFIERTDLTVWRRLHASGCFEYKVYGSYRDVSTEDFLNVQIDTNYRRKWDETAVTLEIVEKDPSATSHSDIVYWEMAWPRLFSNRDYVFNRRYLVDYQSKIVLVVSKGTDHPKCPTRKGKVRVADYWSCMVIKPHSDMNKPGIEFSLTYFDNPGVNIPSSVTTWVAMRAMPDFLDRLRDAAKKYKAYCKQENVKCICSIVDQKQPCDDGDEDDDPYHEYGDQDDDDLIMDDTMFDAYCIVKKRRDREETATTTPAAPVHNTTINNHFDNTNNINNNMLSPGTTTTTVQNESRNFWKYLQPTYYFH